jgi:hypothetical protein
LAARTNRFDVAKLLLEKGAEVDSRDSKNWTPLHIAAQQGSRDVVQLLIERGAAVNAQMTQGWTPLHSAASKGHETVLGLLVFAGGDTRITDDHGQSPESIALNLGRRWQCAPNYFLAMPRDYPGPINICVEGGKVIWSGDIPDGFTIVPNPRM